jgi:hypothetical protein
MKRLMTILFVFILVIIVFILFACRSRSIGQPAPEPTNTFTPTATFTPTPTATVRIISAGMVDDFADCEGNNVFNSPWFSYCDSANTVTNPPPVITPGYAGGSDCAIKFEGNAAASCGYGVWLANALLAGAPADLRGATGIRFQCKGSGSYRLVFLSQATQNNFQYNFTASSSWTQIEAPFSSFTQASSDYGIVTLQQALNYVTHIDFANGSCNMTIDLLVDNLEIY